MPDPPALRPAPRIAALDAARALGVVAMVAGHTLDALLSPAAREAPLVVAYWKARGFTAPLFLVAAGWAAAAAIRRSGASGLAAARGRLPRVLLLLAIGYTLRWPGWGIELLQSGDRATWAHLLAFDALHAIALSLLAASIVLALPWTVREKSLALALLAALCVSLGLSSPAPLPVDPAALPASPVAIALAQAAGGTSTFPLFPWAAYFLVGTILGLLAREDGARTRGMAALGGALVLATAWTGVGTMPSGHPVLFAYRTGAVLLALAALSAVPASLAARAAPLGRASLGAYALHVAVIYGWSTHDGLVKRIGPTLSLPLALAAAGLVLGASLAFTSLFRAAHAALTEIPSPTRPAVATAAESGCEAERSA